MSVKNEARYSGSASVAYDRQPPIQERRRSLSPGPSAGYPSYDRYVPGRTTPVYRDGYSSTYRQDSWRPDRPYYNAPYGGPPSSDRYGSPRNGDQESWPRPSWRSPDVPAWSERRIGQPSMYENSWSRPRRDTMAQPMFEPSENWKQTHGFPSELQEGATKERDYERHPDLPLRDQSPERPFRTNLSPPYSPTERFRRPPPVQDFRDPYSYSHTRSDSYRPYFDRGPWESPYYPDDYQSGYEPPVRLAPYGRFAGRNRRRQRSVSGGSVQNGVHSPIRTRTNLPDRTQMNTRSPSDYAPDTSLKHSDSYTVSPISRTRSRSPSWSSSRSSRFERVERIDAPTMSQKQSDQDEDARMMQRDVSEALTNQEQRTRSPEITIHNPVGTIEESVDIPMRDGDAQPYEVKTSIDETTDTLSTLKLEQHLVQGSAGILEDTSQSVPEPIPAVVTPSARPAEITQTSQEGSPEPDIPLSVQHRRSSAQSGTMRSRAETPPGEPIPLSEALRMVVAMRLQCDRQTQEERVDPVLRDNLSKVEQVPAEATSPDTVIEEATSPESAKDREESFRSVKPSLEVLFAQRQADLNEKVQQVREDYLTLHERWLVQCTKLDEVARTLALQEAAATAGRTTRRSAASMGDAVRSDLEMEQIIASLGNEELTDANHLGARNAAKIPDMISVTSGEVEYLFDDTNNEVENPSEFYVPHTRMEDWTDEEITILVEKFAEFPKQFGIIADFLPDKTAAECVAFYYLHKHKHIDFRKVVARRAASKRKRGGRKQKSNALLADIMKHDDEVHAKSGSGKRRRTVPLPGAEPRRGRRNAGQDKQTSTETPTPEPDTDARKRKRRATARAVAAAEQDEGNEDGDGDPKPVKRSRRTRKPRTSSATPVGTPVVLDEVSSSTIFATKFIDQTEATAKKKAASNNWSDDDRALFLRLLAQYGDDFKRIASSMPNKTTIQVSTFYKANVVVMDLEKIVRGAPKRSPSPDNESWADVTLPGSGAVTPSISSSSTPAEAYLGMNYNGYPFDSHYRMNVPVSSSTYGTYGMSYPQMSNTSMSNSGGPTQFFSTTVESMRAQYGASVDLRSSGPGGDTLLGLSSRPLSLGQISYQPPSAAPATFRTAFRSTFPYSSLSPASFAARDSGVRSTSTRAARTQNGEASSPQPGENSMTNASMAFDATPSFIHPPQSWTRPPLHTTEDLAAYLDHRTNLSGRQQ